MTTCRVARTVMRLAITLLFANTFLLAGLAKCFEGAAPEWFVEQFAETPLGSSPQTPLFLSLAVGEALLGFGAVASLLCGEWFRNRAPLLKLVLAGSLLLFVALGFGARLSHKYEDAAFHFMYFTGTLLALVVIDRDDRLAATCSVDDH
ncbi:MAG: hypothetical protein P8M53_06650 [Pirellulales bacterium]|nr:hypothetical protein [Pirellulales bacterium]